MWPDISVLLVYFAFLLCLIEAHISKRQTSRRCSSSEISSITFMAHCYTQINGKENQVDCAVPAVPGTIARINCKWSYERTNALFQTTTCKSNGLWSPSPTECTQICGQDAIDATPLIIGGKDVNIKKVPWHVAIYREVGENNTLIQQCGGTIISSKVIVSAAHCFWNSGINKLNSESFFRVVAGKYYRDLYDPREKNSYQTLGVEKIHLVPGYLDYEGLYANDVAVVVLSDYIEFKVNVAPICIEPYKFDEKVVPPGLVGRVAGWGLLQSAGEPSETLKELEMPVVQREACLSELDHDFHPFVTSDKFCAGSLTGSNVCRGDSGGGLVFPKMINGRNIYFLRGVVSTGQNKDGSCNNDKYALFTNTAHFYDLIEYHEIANRPSSPPQIATNKGQRPSSQMENPCSFGECVPYYLCQNGTIITNGASLLNKRKPRQTEECSNLFQLCCSLGGLCGVRNAAAEFSWHAAITESTVNVSSAYVCGGSLIDTSVILTAAQCIIGKEPKQFKVHLGEWGTRGTDTLFPLQVRNVVEFVLHPEYDDQTLLNDVALLYLDKPAEISSSVNTICLPPSDTIFDYSSCLATGGTRMEENSKKMYKKPIELPVVPRPQCESWLRETRLGQYFRLHDNFICAGGEPGTKTCGGDAGSPLVCPIAGTKNRYYQAGIASWDIGCGDHAPGVYANVAVYRQWIDDELQRKHVQSTSYTYQ